MDTQTCDLEINQGESDSLQVQWLDDQNDPIDLTEWTAKMTVRRTTADENVVFSLTDDSGITISALEGSLLVEIPAEQTATMSGKYVYDLWVYNGTTKKMLVEGKIKIDPSVTR